MKKIPIVSIVGYSGSGKTTLVEKMIPELKRRGWRVATIKHNRHGFEIDHEGKDSWRHRRAGADMTVLASPGKVAVMADTEGDLSLEELGDRFIRGVDVILTEGFKKNPTRRSRSGARPWARSSSRGMTMPFWPWPATIPEG
jgi:molybdopterin-guanine dinucleotide biosynthesis protein MobB